MSDRLEKELLDLENEERYAEWEDIEDQIAGGGPYGRDEVTLARRAFDRATREGGSYFGILLVHENTQEPAGAFRDTVLDLCARDHPWAQPFLEYAYARTTPDRVVGEAILAWLRRQGKSLWTIDFFLARFVRRCLRSP